MLQSTPEVHMQELTFDKLERQLPSLRILPRFQGSLEA
jgi:hypothetical protein